jgi:hypothetical protein
LKRNSNSLVDAQKWASRPFRLQPSPSQGWVRMSTEITARAGLTHLVAMQRQG